MWNKIFLNRVMVRNVQFVLRKLVKIESDLGKMVRGVKE